MTDWKKIRAQFPVVKNYAYFSAAASAPIPKCVRDAGKKYYDQMCDQGDVAWEGWLEEREHARKLAAKIIGTKAPNVAFTMNTSHGMAIAGGGWRFLKWYRHRWQWDKPRWEYGRLARGRARAPWRDTDCGHWTADWSDAAAYWVGHRGATLLRGPRLMS